MSLSCVVAGAGYYVPEKVLDNAYFEGLNPLHAYDKDGKIIEDVYTSHEKIMEVMGIRERRQAAPGEEVHHLALKAAQHALRDAGMGVDDLEGIVVATVSNWQRFPNTAVRVKEFLNARNVNFCLDVGAACAGFPYALDIADKRAKETGRPCLAIAAEALTRITDYTDRDCALFGDGAGAMVLLPVEGTERGVKGFVYRTDPFEGKADWIFQHPLTWIKMPEAGEVLRKAIRMMVELTVELKGQLGWKDDVALYVPHQANDRIVEGYLRRLGVERERVFNNIEWYGNTSAVTCPMGYAQAKEQGRLPEGSKCVIASLGSGLQACAAGIIS